MNSIYSILIYFSVNRKAVVGLTRSLISITIVIPMTQESSESNFLLQLIRTDGWLALSFQAFTAEGWSGPVSLKSLLLVFRFQPVDPSNTSKSTDFQRSGRLVKLQIWFD